MSIIRNAAIGFFLRPYEQNIISSSMQLRIQKIRPGMFGRVSLVFETKAEMQGLRAFVWDTEVGV